MANDIEAIHQRAQVQAALEQLSNLNSKQFAALMDVAEITVRTWRRTGFGPDYVKRPGGRNAKVVYRKQDVMRWLESNKLRSTSDQKVAVA